LILLGGSLGDRFGRVRVFLAGIAVFTVASGLCAAAPTTGFLIGERLLGRGVVGGPAHPRDA
jgi:MFS family permease